jgi:hypothetical protein
MLKQEAKLKGVKTENLLYDILDSARVPVFDTGRS